MAASSLAESASSAGRSAASITPRNASKPSRLGGAMPSLARYSAASAISSSSQALLTRMAAVSGAWESLSPTVTLPRLSSTATLPRTAGSSRSSPCGRRQRTSSPRPFTLLISQLQPAPPLLPLARANPVMLEMRIVSVIRPPRLDYFFSPARLARQRATLRLCSSRVAAKACPPEPSATK